MEKRFAFELRRKAVHVFSLLYILIYLFFREYWGHSIALLALTFVLIFFFGMEYFRVKKRKKIPLFHIFWREKEKNRLGGQVYFLLGAIIAFAVFDFRIAIAALLMTTFGDMAAALIGIPFGRHYLKKEKDRAWEGIIAQFVVDVVIGFLLLESWFVILGMALVATWVETKFAHVDDNLSIPVFAGFVGMVLKMII